MTSPSEPDPPDVDKDRQYVTALARGLQILRCFTHLRPELNSSELARMTGLPQSTVWRLCYTLAREGFIVCDEEGGKMSLGLPALSLGYAVLARQELPKIALPSMQALTARYQVGTSLSTREGLDMVYLQRTHGDFIYFNDPVGTRRPLATAPTGWAYLAGCDEAERSAVLTTLKEHDGTAWPLNERRILQALADYRQDGFILSIGVLHPHFNAVAVPIRSAGSGKVFGLTVSGLAAEWTRERLITIAPELVALAQQLAIVAT